MAASGDICPQLGPGAAIVPSPAPPGTSGLCSRSASPRGPLSPGTKVAGVIPGSVPERPSWERVRSGGARASVAARGDLVRGCTARPRTASGSARRAGRAGRACGGVPGLLSSAPRSRPPEARLPPSPPPRSRTRVGVSEPARGGDATGTTGPLCASGPGRGSSGIFILRGSCSRGEQSGRSHPLITEPQPARPAVGAGKGIPLL